MYIFFHLDILKLNSRLFRLKNQLDEIKPIFRYLIFHQKPSALKKNLFNSNFLNLFLIKKLRNSN